MSEFIGLHTPISWLSTQRRSGDAPMVAQGIVALSVFRRVVAAMAVDGGDLGDCHYRLAIGADTACRSTIDGQVEATLRLTCQRCLQPMAWPVAAVVSVTVVETERAFDQLAAAREPLLLTADRQRLSDVIEEELLLAIPLVPMHADSDSCVIHDAVDTVDGVNEAAERGIGDSANRVSVLDGGHRQHPANPFALLASLKKEP